METPVRQRLEAVRRALLNLHKALIDSERVTYEQTIGRIQSPGHFLQLVTSDPWFAWLQPLSQLIVCIDEVQDSKNPLTSAEFEALTQQTRRLLTPSETGEGFSRHYRDSMQREPDVVLAHGELMKVLGVRKNIEGR